METEAIIKGLERYTGVFPREALEAAVANQEAITPGLLQVLEWVRDNLTALMDDDSYVGHLTASFLLAQFRETSAYPLIIDIVSGDSDAVDVLWGDIITEDLNRVLASVSGGDTGPMLQLARNSEANEYVREAALSGLVTLVACGQKSRDEVMEIYEGLFRGGLERKASVAWGGLVCCCLDLHPKEVCEDIEQAYAEGLVDPEIVRFKDVGKEAARDPEAVLADTSKRQPGLIDDAAEELKRWLREAEPVHNSRRSRDDDLLDSSDYEDMSGTSEKPKTGRNDPCPCGSGKKYKRCCGK